MSRKLTYFPLIMDRWTAGTRHLTFEQKGFYLDLIVWLFDTGKSIKDADHAARILCCDPRTSRRLLADLSGKFRRSSAGLRHKLVDELLRNGGKIRGLQPINFPIDPDPDPDPEEEKDTLSPKPPFSAKKPRGKQAYPDAFEALWITRPARAGGDDKRRALQAWNARIAEQHSQETIRAGVDRYRSYCEKTGKVGTEYVKQLATFLGPSDPPHFTLDWTAPINGNNSGPKTYDDYNRNIKEQIAACSADAGEADGEWMDMAESAEVLGEDGRPVRTAVVQRLRTRTK